MQRNLTKGPITVNLLLFALPLMFGNLLQQLYNVSDTWVVGRYLAQNYGAKEEKRIKGNLDVSADRVVFGGHYWNFLLF